MVESAAMAAEAKATEEKGMDEKRDYEDTETEDEDDMKVGTTKCATLIHRTQDQDSSATSFIHAVGTGRFCSQ